MACLMALIEKVEVINNRMNPISVPYKPNSQYCEALSVLQASRASQDHYQSSQWTSARTITYRAYSKVSRICLVDSLYDIFFYSLSRPIVIIRNFVFNSKYQTLKFLFSPWQKSMNDALPKFCGQDSISLKATYLIAYMYKDFETNQFVIFDMDNIQPCIQQITDAVQKGSGKRPVR